MVCRYSVKVTEDHLASVQVNTSKLDVYIKLVILDNEIEVASTQGKGHAVIPSFIFLKDLDPNEEKRPSSRTCKSACPGLPPKEGFLLKVIQSSFPIYTNFYDWMVYLRMMFEKFVEFLCPRPERSAGGI